MTDAKKHDMSGNQGEGNRGAARAYNEEQREFVEEGRVDEAAQKAKEAMSAEERERLEKAEKEGKSHAKDVDPNVKRDY